MTHEEMVKKAHDMISNTRNGAKDLKLAHRERFFSGTVVVFDYLEGESKRRDYVYFDDSGSIIHSQSFEGFLKSFADKGDRSLTKIVYGFGGSVALLLIGTFCYLAATKTQIPEPLSAALTVILGFFFGTIATSSRKS